MHLILAVFLAVLLGSAEEVSAQACGANTPRYCVDSSGNVWANGLQPRTGATGTFALGVSSATSFKLTALTNQLLFASNATNTGQFTMAALTASRTWTLPDATGTFAVGATSPITLSAGGTVGCTTCALTALSNLSGVAINTALLPGSVNAIDLGSTTNWFRDTYLGTSATNYFKITGVPTANRTLTLPDAAGTVAVSATSPVTLSAAGAIGCTTCALTGLSNLSGVAINTALLPVTSGTVDLGSSTFWFRNIYLSSSTTQYFLLTGTPTSSRTLTLPDAAWTVAVSAASPITLSAAGAVGLTAPNCTDTGGNHLNFVTSTNTISCGTSIPGIAFARVSSTSDITTGSTTFIGVTGMTLTLVTGANPVVCGFSAMTNNTGLNDNFFDISVDAVAQGGTNGSIYANTAFGADTVNVSFTYQTAALTAASHTFTPTWRVSAGTGTIRGNPTANFWCHEVH